MIRLSIVLTILVLLISPAITYAGTYALYSTGDRDGWLRKDTTNTCSAGPWNDVAYHLLDYAKTGIERPVSTLWQKNRSFFSFNLLNVPEVITSAILRLTVKETNSTDLEQNIALYCGDCCIGETGCASILHPDDWEDCMDSLTTVLWDSIPAADDSFFVNIPVEYIIPGAGHTFDIRIVSSIEGDVCSIGVGLNTVVLFTAEKIDPKFRPVLYIEGTESNCSIAGRIWLNTVNDSLSFCDGNIIRHVNYEDDWEVKLCVVGFCAF